MMDQAEVRTPAQGDFTDVDLTVILETGDPDQEATANRVLFSRKLHYLISQLVKDSAKLVVRQNEDANGFRDLEETLQEVLAARSHAEHGTFDAAVGL